MVKIYIFACKLWNKLFSLSRICFSGFWLAIFKKETFHTIDKFYYDNNKMYYGEGYNKRGLYDWEGKAIDRYLKRCKHLLVGAVGGGREVLALRKLGYDVDAFECHPGLVRYANDLLKKQGLAPDVQLVSRDTCPKTGKVYDGVVIGWGAYTLIRGKKQRVAFLRDLRRQMKKGSPLFLSFMCRTSIALHYRAIAVIGNALKMLLWRKDYLEEGDNLSFNREVFNYIHCFTREEILAELREAGFELAFYSSEGYGHAVGVAS